MQALGASGALAWRLGARPETTATLGSAVVHAPGAVDAVGDGAVAAGAASRAPSTGSASDAGDVAVDVENGRAARSSTAGVAAAGAKKLRPGASAVPAGGAAAPRLAREAAARAGDAAVGEDDDAGWRSAVRGARSTYGDDEASRDLPRADPRRTRATRGRDRGRGQRALVDGGRRVEYEGRVDVGQRPLVFLHHPQPLTRLDQESVLRVEVGVAVDDHARVAERDIVSLDQEQLTIELGKNGRGRVVVFLLAGREARADRGALVRELALFRDDDGAGRVARGDERASVRGAERAGSRARRRRRHAIVVARVLHVGRRRVDSRRVVPAVREELAAPAVREELAEEEVVHRDRGEAVALGHGRREVEGALFEHVREERLQNGRAAPDLRRSDVGAENFGAWTYAAASIPVLHLFFRQRRRYQRPVRAFAEELAVRVFELRNQSLLRDAEVGSEPVGHRFEQEIEH